MPLIVVILEISFGGANLPPGFQFWEMTEPRLFLRKVNGVVNNRGSFFCYENGIQTWLNWKKEEEYCFLLIRLYYLFFQYYFYVFTLGMPDYSWYG